METPKPSPKGPTGKIEGGLPSAQKMTLESFGDVEEITIRNMSIMDVAAWYADFLGIDAKNPENAVGLVRLARARKQEIGLLYKAERDLIERARKSDKDDGYLEELFRDASSKGGINVERRISELHTLGNNMIKELRSNNGLPAMKTLIGRAAKG